MDDASEQDRKRRNTARKEVFRNYMAELLSLP